MSTTPPTQKRRLPSSPSLSPRFFQPKPSSMAHSGMVSSQHSRTPSRASATTPRPHSPQESFFTAFSYPSPKSMSPTSPMTRPFSFSPHLRHLSPAPSSGVSSVRSMSDHESSDEELLSPLTQNPKVHLPEPQSDEEDDEDQKYMDARDLDIELADPSFVPLDLGSDTTSLFSDHMFYSAAAAQYKHATSITIEELPALPLSPALSRTNSSGSTTSSCSMGNNSHVSWQDSGIEIIQGEYSSCASSSELDDTTDDPQTEDDETDDFEWNVDVCSSSYPTDDFLLGGLLGLSTSGVTSPDMGLGLGYPKGMDRSYSISDRPATPFLPRKARSYATVPSTFLTTHDLEKSVNSNNNTLKRRSLNTPNTKKRRRIYSLFNDDDGEGDDESDEAESPSPAKRVKGRMTIDSVLNGSMRKQQKEHGMRRGSLSQMFGLAMGEDMDVDL
ncbi:hypothetical protein ABW20_dc0100978 [Dactylellina cionopaga]|nr:hypothetical protein ABW20_dc0100978 [Dactylellina cionopaga]